MKLNHLNALVNASKSYARNGSSTPLNLILDRHIKISCSKIRLNNTSCRIYHGCCKRMKQNPSQSLHSSTNSKSVQSIGTPQFLPKSHPSFPTNAPPKPTKKQLRELFVISAVPMIGFGFMDNFIMIQAGGYIDSTLGVKFGLATMTAAAMGQVVSDVR